MFFVGCYMHPIPKKYERKMKPYDKLVYRHRMINIYHGFAALCLGAYWYLLKLDVTCGRRNSDLELVILSNTGAYFVMDIAFMKWEGFLDTGNLIHHIFGILGYYSCAYLQHDYWMMIL
jgi:hypothetical protein